MHLTGTNVFIATFAVGTILSLLQPLGAPASILSGSTSQAHGQSVAVASSSAQLIPLLDESSASTSAIYLASDMLEQPHVASFKENSEVISALRTTTIASKENTVVIASAKQAESKTESITEVKVQAAVAVHPSLTQAPEQTTQAVDQVVEAAQDTSVYALNADKLFDMVNSHRVSIGLPALARNEEVMNVARSRAPELFDEIFVNGNMHAGFHARNLPYPSNENIIYYNTEEGAMNWWLNSYVHRAAIENPAYTHAGIGCDGKSCSMIFATL